MTKKKRCCCKCKKCCPKPPEGNDPCAPVQGVPLFNDLFNLSLQLGVLRGTWDWLGLLSANWPAPGDICTRDNQPIPCQQAAFEDSIRFCCNSSVGGGQPNMNIALNCSDTFGLLNYLVFIIDTNRSCLTDPKFKNLLAAFDLVKSTIEKLKAAWPVYNGNVPQLFQDYKGIYNTIDSFQNGFIAVAPNVSPIPGVGDLLFSDFVAVFSVLRFIDYTSTYVAFDEGNRLALSATKISQICATFQRIGSNIRSAIGIQDTDLSDKLSDWNVVILKFCRDFTAGNYSLTDYTSGGTGRAKDLDDFVRSNSGVINAYGTDLQNLYKAILPTS